jgi:DNA-binding MarR family transcriptional regulator
MAVPAARSQIRTSKNPISGAQSFAFLMINSIRTVASDTSQIRMRKMRRGPRELSSKASTIPSPSPKQVGDGNHPDRAPGPGERGMLVPPGLRTGKPSFPHQNGSLFPSAHPYLSIKILYINLFIKKLDIEIILHDYWPMKRDLVDQVLDDWRRARPDLDADALGVSSRLVLLSKVLAREDKRFLATLDLAPWACDVLLALRRQGPPFELTPTQLRKMTLLTSGATTARLDGLEASGLVRRMPDPGDRRSFRIALTDRGLGLSDQAIEARLEMADGLIADLSREEREMAADLLRKLLLNGGGPRK